MDTKNLTALSRFLARVLFYLFSLIAPAFSNVAYSDDIVYTYDSGNRLQIVQYDDGQSVRYVYDNLGNQLQRLTLSASQENALPSTVTASLADGTTDVDSKITLDWSAASDTDTDDQIVYYLYLGTGENPPLVYSGWNHSYTPPFLLTPLTQYTWKVVARDSQGGESTSGPWSFTTGNEPPTAVIAAKPSEAIVPFTATLTDASISNDDAIASRAWDFLCDGSVDASAISTTYNVSAAGEFPICLQVTDENGASSDTKITLYGRIDTDKDGVFDLVDNCPNNANSDQFDLDEDGKGDVCDEDRDGDGVDNDNDVFPDDKRYTSDTDGDGIADAWEMDQFGDLSTADENSDYDNDSSADIDEFRYDSDPKFVPPFLITAAIDAGSNHNLAQRTDGSLYAWGYNANGQLGEGSRITQGYPAFVRNVTGDFIFDIADIATGNDHSVALLSNGSVIAWGYNSYGQLGNGTNTQQLNPVKVVKSDGDFLTEVVAVAAGGNHSLALLNDGTVLAWGYNGYGQLGDGTTTAKTTPTSVKIESGDPLTGIIAIKAGENFSMALRSDGTVLTWGYNGYGQLGDDSTTTRHFPARVLNVRGGAITQITDIAAGYQHALALTKERTALAWGYNFYGQVGDGSIFDSHHATQVVDENGAPINNLIRLAAGSWHSLGLTDSGEVMAWGRNNSGQLGDGTITDRNTPTDIGLGNITEIASGSEYSLALTDNLTVFAWGKNDRQQLGDGTTNNRRSPVAVIDNNLNPIFPVGKPSSNADADSDGDGEPDATDSFPYDPLYQHDTDEDGLADEWEQTQFGNLTTADDKTDTDGDGLTDAHEFLSGSNPNFAPPFSESVLASGAEHTLALRRDGRVLVWGNNRYGQLGNGTTSNNSYPQLLPDLHDIRAVAAGRYHSLALAADGSVWAWGYNGQGQLGDDTTTAHSTPTRVLDTTGNPINGVIAIAAGENHSLALRADGTVWLWGDNGYGQLGDGTNVDIHLPRRLSDLNNNAITGVKQISAGLNHCFALRNDGRLLAWGQNNYGQLGDNSTTTQFQTALVLNKEGSALAEIAQIAAGQTHSVALTNGGEVLSWGNNAHGQLGDGTTTRRRYPDRVLGIDQFPLAEITSISAGWNHTLAIKKDGTILAWGENNAGQLGAPIHNWSTFAVSVAAVTNVVTASSGQSHSTALLDDMTLMAWGEGNSGQLGNGSFWEQKTAVIVRNGNLQPLPYIGSASTGDADNDEVSDSEDAYPLDARYHADSDSDGLADAWEQQYFNDLDTADASTDSDGDGILDADEFAHESNPKEIPVYQSQVIAAGEYHSLALQRDGTVLAWGYNHYGQLGIENNQDQASPQIVSNLTDIVALAAGDNHSLALERNGRVWAWGYNRNGELGDGTTETRHQPVAVLNAAGEPLSGIIAIAAGNNHSMALRTDGTVLLWGYNGYQQIGDGTNTATAVPKQLRSHNNEVITGIIAIGAGNNHSLALKADGSLLGWGKNNSGQLGDNTNTGRNYPVAALDLRHKILNQISTFNTHGDFTLIRLANNSALAWGANNYGQLGDGTTQNRNYPRPIIDTDFTPINNVTGVAAGLRHSIALLSNGKILSWGDNHEGQLGDGFWINRYQAGLVTTFNESDLEGVLTITSGHYHSLALLADGSLMAWGDNNYGQLGNGAVGDQPWAVAVLNYNADPITNIGAPGDPTDPTLDSDGDGVVDNADDYPFDPRYTSDSDGDGLPDSWEQAHFSNLTTANNTTDTDGDGVLDTDEFANGADPNFVPVINDKTTLAVGGYHTLSIRNDGRLLAWGDNRYGQLGDNTTKDRIYPQLLEERGDIRAVAAGEYFSLALDKSGHVWSWGYNGHGELGDGSNENRVAPVKVLNSAGDPLNGIIAISAGRNFSAALRADGTVWTWGYNSNGELGDGTKTNSSVPIQLIDSNGQTLNSIVAISSGWNHLLALKADGRILAWGYNGSGQQGDDTTRPRLRPRLVLDDGYQPLDDIIAINAAGHHSHALHKEGYVLSWGQNSYGQLGDGTKINSTLPEWVIDENRFPLQNIEAIASGNEFSLALSSEGKVLTWGRNDKGQLGEGVLIDRSWAAPAQGEQAVLTSIKRIAAGGQHVLAQRETEQLLAWGNNDNSQLGNGSIWNQPLAIEVINGNRQPLLYIGTPTTDDADNDEVSDSDDAYPLDARYHADSDSDGLADAWEQQYFNDLVTADASTDTDGDGILDADEFVHESNPVEVPDYQSQIIAVGGKHSLGKRKDGTVLAWGYNTYGQLGIGNNKNQAFPQIISNLSDIVSLSAGENHSLALAGNGRIWAWGYNNYGQLGDGTTETRYQPVAVLNAAGEPLAGIIAIAAGNNHSMALRADGTVLLWGYNGYQQIGDGTNTATAVPKQLRSNNNEIITGIIAIGAGNRHSLALKADGSLLGWGNNSSSQLGDGTNTGRPYPIAALDLRHKTLNQISAFNTQGDFTLIVFANGTARSWGANNYGQLGDGTASNHGYPLPIVDNDFIPLNNVTQVAAGWRHGLALQGDGNVLSWGNNDEGQLGDGSWTNHRQAVAVFDINGTMLTGVKFIAGGGNHSLALTNDGTLVAWGDNSYGQLGSGSGEDGRVARPVTNEAGFVIDDFGNE